GTADDRQLPALELVDAFAREDRGQAHQTNSSPPPARLIWPASARRRAVASTSFCAASTSDRRTGPFTSRSSRSMSAARLDMLAKIFSRIAASAPLSAVIRRADG